MGYWLFLKGRILADLPLIKKEASEVVWKRYVILN